MTQMDTSSHKKRFVRAKLAVDHWTDPSNVLIFAFVFL
jgi:hypothetical protein